jgi:hypothetical protein
MKAEETDEKAIFCWKRPCFEPEKHPSLQDKIEAHRCAYTSEKLEEY